MPRICDLFEMLSMLRKLGKQEMNNGNSFEHGKNQPCGQSMKDCPETSGNGPWRFPAGFRKIDKITGKFS